MEGVEVEDTVEDGEYGVDNDGVEDDEVDDGVEN